MQNHKDVDIVSAAWLLWGTKKRENNLVDDGKNNLVDDSRKGEKNKRRVKKKFIEPYIDKNTDILIRDTIRKDEDLDIPGILLLLGECLLYESLFIWQREAIKRYKTESPRKASELFGDMLPVIRRNHRTIVKLLLELPHWRNVTIHQQVVESGDVSNQALIRARMIVLHLLTIRQFEHSDEIRAYFVENVKTSYIPSHYISNPIIETFGICLHIVSAEGDNSP